MRWPWSAPDSLLPGDEQLHCPTCRESTECISLFRLRTPVRRGGVVTSVTVGDRLMCQRCGETFSVGHRGVFRHKEPIARGGRLAEVPSPNGFPDEPVSQPPLRIRPPV
jgi:hypothetical protein